MIQERQTSVQRCFQRNDQHPRGCKGQVKDNDSGQKEEEDGEQDRSKKKLIEVIIA